MFLHLEMDKILKVISGIGGDDTVRKTLDSTSPKAIGPVASKPDIGGQEPNPRPNPPRENRPRAPPPRDHLDN